MELRRTEYSPLPLRGIPPLGGGQNGSASVATRPPLGGWQMGSASLYGIHTEFRRVHTCPPAGRPW